MRILPGHLVILPFVLLLPEVKCSTELEVKPPAEEKGAEVRFHVRPHFSSLFIDYLEVAVDDPSTLFGQEYRCRLRPGRHKVIIQSECCYDDEFVILVPEHGEENLPLVFRRKLSFLPAELVIETGVGGVEVWVDAVFRGTVGPASSTPIAISLTGMSGERQIRLWLVHPELGETRRTLSVKAGSRTVVVVERKVFSRP